MASPEPVGPERVGVVAPVGRDAALIRDCLEGAGLPAEVCSDVGAMAAGVAAGRLSVLVLTAEAVIGSGAVERLRDALRAQPAWSDVPLLLLTARGRPAGEGVRLLGLVGARLSATVIERPVPPSSLVGAVRLAALARERQREVRDLVVALERANAELEARVEDRTREVRRLAAQLTRAEHEERRRIAHLLHDDLQQRLHGLSITLSLLGRALPDDLDRAAALLDRADRTLDGAATLTRSLSHEMAPPLLRDGDLGELFEWIAARKRDLHGLQVEPAAAGVSVPEEDLRVLLHRVLWELLFNVSKHAGTDQARVTAERDGPAVRVTVSDDGVGFRPDALDGESGLGLASVRERLGLVGGRVEVASAPGAGTRVTVEVPSPAGATNGTA